MSANSCLNFKGYEITKLNYEPIETEISEFTLAPKFARTITECDENEYFIDLSVEFKPTEELPLPFVIEVSMRGHFHIEENDKAVKESIIRDNTVAIMFPYLRMVVSSLTTSANITPVFLPIINITQAFNENEENAR